MSDDAGLLRVAVRPPRSEWDALLTRPAADAAALEARVRPILDRVRAEGDAALVDFTRRFDGVELESLHVPDDALDAAAREVPPELKDALETAAANVRRFHEAQREGEIRVETMPGVVCWRRSVPVERVGLYVPGGTAPLVSSLVMLAVPAAVAGCRTVVACSPPGPDGEVPAVIRYAARTLGVTALFRLGGAQAVAAMAYGTESVPRVDKLFGPGNAYVTAAKQLAARDGVAIDLPAGPSEVLVVADQTARPEWVAADLLAQAEHGPDSQVVLVTTDEALPARVSRALAAQLADLPRADVARRALAHARAVVVDTLDDALAVSEHYAPEHLILALEDAEAFAARVSQAGSVFLGGLTPESAGDYASGTNHTLPTNGYARAYSGVSLDSFVRKVTFQRLAAGGLAALGPTVETLARAEGLEAHARAVSLRLDALAPRF